MEPNGRCQVENEKPGVASRTPSPTPLEKAPSPKAAKVLEACKWKDIERLRVLATSEGGLVSDNVRRQAWPLLLGYAGRDKTIKLEGGSADSWRELPSHRDEAQVQLDVDRSFIFYPKHQSAKDIDRLKVELSDLILEVLRRQPYLHYFQGYHDICSVFLLVLEPQHRAAAVARLTVLRIRDYMLPTLAPSLAQLRLIPSIIYSVNPRLYKHLPLTQPFFAIAGIITMYAHDIQEQSDICRVFDVLLAREAVFSVYMFAQIVLQRSEELFEVPSDEPEMLHSILSKLPRPLALETLIENTVELFERHPPESLKAWHTISDSSVLRTARYPDQTLSQSLEDGEVYFQKQVKDLQWVEQKEKVLNMIWKNRKFIRGFGIAVLVGVFSFWLRRSAGPSGVLGSFWRYWQGYSGH